MSSSARSKPAGPLIDAAHHALSCRPAAGRRCALLADPVRLAQVLSNLLNNAAKYTDPGGRIALDARREGDEAVLVVRDNGLGIATDQIARVFDLFSQAEHSIGHAAGGLGIGLTLVRSLVEMHGGSVIARSAGLGQGSEFEVRLPLARGRAADVAAADERDAAPPARACACWSSTTTASTPIRLRCSCACRAIRCGPRTTRPRR